MKHVPYFQTTKHKVIFLIFVSLAVIVNVLFITAIILAMGIDGPLKDDPVENAILFLLVIFTFLWLLYSILFIIDLISYHINKHRAKKEANSNNKPVIQEETKLVNEPISEENKTDGQEAPIYDFKEKHDPSFKKTFMTMNFANGPAVIILGLLLVLIVFVIVAACNITHDGPTILIRCAIGAAITVAVVLLLHILTVYNTYSNVKKLTPVDNGTKVFANYMESYTDIDQDFKNTHVKSILKTRIDFSIRARTKETKKYYIVDQMVNKKTAIMVFDKSEVPEEALAFIKSKIKKQ